MRANSESAARLEKLFAGLDTLKIDAAVLDRRNDQFYFTSFTGSDSFLLLFAKTRQAMLLTDPRYREEAEISAPGAETLIWKASPAHHAALLLKKNRVKAVAFTPGSLPAAFYQALLAEAPGVKRYHNLEPEIMALRSVKSKAETACLRASLKCAQTAFALCRKDWKPGMTESDVKNDLDYRMKKLGAQATGFATIAAVGANASLPHAHSGMRKIQPGKMLLVDFGAEVNRYTSDLTRTMWCREIPRVWQKRYQAVLEAQRAGIAAIRAGVPGSVPDKAAREVLAQYGLADRFTHGFGHAIGLAVHEDPRLNAKNDIGLEAGNVVSAEPGVYFPGVGGIRIEDMVLVTGEGGEVLSSLPKDLDSAVF